MLIGVLFWNKVEIRTHREFSLFVAAATELSDVLHYFSSFIYKERMNTYLSDALNYNILGKEVGIFYFISMYL
jgi:hypothetical protein